MQEATHDLIFNHLAPDYMWRYFAVDENGIGHVFTWEPRVSGHGWCSAGHSMCIGKFNPEGWQNSLIIRLFNELDESWFNRDDCPTWAKYAFIGSDGFAIVSTDAPYEPVIDDYCTPLNGCVYRKMTKWGAFRMIGTYYTRPSKKKGDTPMYTKQEAAGISKNVAVAALKKHVEDGVKKSVETGLRTWLVPTSCFVPNMLDKEDFVQILVNTGYKLEELDNGDFELRWR